MKPRVQTLALAALSLAPLLTAQNEIVFVGTTLGVGPVDPFFFCSAGTGTIVHSGGNIYSDNATDAVWMDLGTNLYLGKVPGLPASNFLTRAHWNGTSATWSTFFPGSCYGLGADRAHKRLWTLTGGTGATRELVCLDADPASASYGTMLAQTTTLSGVNRDRWELSHSGRFAAVPHYILSSGLFEIVDTDLVSPSFGQIVRSSPVSGAAGSVASDCAFSGDDLFAYVLYTGLGTQGLAVMFVPASSWLDFDATTPGQQDIVINLPGPSLMDVSPYSYAPVISGNGWAARIDLDPFLPHAATLTQYQPGVPLTGTDAISLSADGRRVAVYVASPPSVLVFDFQNGSLLHNIPLFGASNVRTIAWQDLRPDAQLTNFGTGCPGTLGAPTLAGTAPPRLGTTVQFLVNNLPQNLAFVVSGLSNTLSGSNPLPMNLLSFGMPGCSLLVDPMTCVAVFGAGSAPWHLAVPFHPRNLGFTMYSQAFVLDPAANALGFTVSNGVRIVAGI